MPLRRTLRRRGKSVSLTVPADVIALLGWAVGTVVEIELAGPALLIRSAKTDPASAGTAR